MVMLSFYGYAAGTSLEGVVWAMIWADKGPEGHENLRTHQASHTTTTKKPGPNSFLPGYKLYLPKGTLYSSTRRTDPPSCCTPQ